MLSNYITDQYFLPWYVLVSLWFVWTSFKELFTYYVIQIWKVCTSPSPFPPPLHALLVIVWNWWTPNPLFQPLLHNFYVRDTFAIDKFLPRTFVNESNKTAIYMVQDCIDIGTYQLNLARGQFSKNIDLLIGVNSWHMQPPFLPSQWFSEFAWPPSPSLLVIVNIFQTLPPSVADLICEWSLINSDWINVILKSGCWHTTSSVITPCLAVLPVVLSLFPVCWTQ